jgi:hypothetical protein
MRNYSLTSSKKTSNCAGFLLRRSKQNAQIFQHGRDQAKTDEVANGKSQMGNALLLSLIRMLVQGEVSERDTLAGIPSSKPQGSWVQLEWDEHYIRNWLYILTR